MEHNLEPEGSYVFFLSWSLIKNLALYCDLVNGTNTKVMRSIPRNCMNRWNGYLRSNSKCLPNARQKFRSVSNQAPNRVPQKTPKMVGPCTKLVLIMFTVPPGQAPAPFQWKGGSYVSCGMTWQRRTSCKPNFLLLNTYLHLPASQFNYHF